METQTWYLELTEEKGSHKFYEVKLENMDLTIRYGRIGDNGQTQKKTLETPEKAMAEAEKKLKEKRKNGYRDAVLGQTEKITAPRATKIPKLQIIGFTEVFEPITEPITKFGGQPVWLENPQWAISPVNGRKIPFLCQIKLEPEIFGEIEAKIAYLFHGQDDDENDWGTDHGNTAIVIQPGNIVHHDLSMLLAPSIYANLTVSEQTGSTLTKEVRNAENLFLGSVQSEWEITTKISKDPQFVVYEIREEWEQEKSIAFSDLLVGHKIGGTPNTWFEDDTPDDFLENWNLLLQLESTDACYDAQLPFRVDYGDGGCGWYFISKDGKRLDYRETCG